MNFLVFPLPGVVFFPSTCKPLNVFEPKKIQLVKDAIEMNSLVAIAFCDYVSPGEVKMRRVAGVGKPTILETRDDGSMLVVFEGMGKVKIGEYVETEKDYLVCKGEWIEESKELNQSNAFRLNGHSKDFNKWLYDNVDDQRRTKIFLDQIKTPEEKVNYICSLMIHDCERQQSLLEMNDINERLEFIVNYKAAGSAWAL